MNDVGIGITFSRFVREEIPRRYRNASQTRIVYLRCSAIPSVVVVYIHVYSDYYILERSMPDRRLTGSSAPRACGYALISIFIKAFPALTSENKVWPRCLSPYFMRLDESSCIMDCNIFIPLQQVRSVLA